MYVSCVFVLVVMTCCDISLAEAGNISSGVAECVFVKKEVDHWNASENTCVAVTADHSRRRSQPQWNELWGVETGVRCEHVNDIVANVHSCHVS